MNPKLLLLAALVCVYVTPALATIPLTYMFGQNALYAGAPGLGFHNPAVANPGNTIGLSGAAMLLGAIPLVMAKALLLRRLTGRRTGWSRRGRREALSEISDEEARRFVMQLIHEYEQAMAHQ